MTDTFLLDPQNQFECIHLDITDELLMKSKIAAYMFDQQLETPEGKVEPFEPKKFPEKAIDILIPIEDLFIIEIYLDSETKCWSSRFRKDGKFGKLSPDQMEQFFRSKFYGKMQSALASKWPISDPTYSDLYKAVLTKQLDVSMSDADISEYNECQTMLQEKDQPNKRKDLANADVSLDGKRDYTGTGRRILHFGDMNVKGNSGKYFCWPRPGKEFKWNTWKDWTKIHPFARMSFVYNGRRYGITLSLFDEQFDNRGFRGYDADWEPPLAWLTPGECAEVMQLSIVKKFLKQCLKRVRHYLDMTPEEVYKKIDKPEHLDVKDIEKTMRVIKHVVDVVFKKQQADNYRYD